MEEEISRNEGAQIDFSMAEAGQISSIGEIFRRCRTWTRLVARACPVGAYRKLFMSRTVANSACARGRLHACTCYRKFRQHPRAAQKHLADAIKTPRKEGERPDLDKPADIAATLINLQGTSSRKLLSRVSHLRFQSLPDLIFRSLVVFYKKKEKKVFKKMEERQEGMFVCRISFIFSWKGIFSRR